MHLSFYAKKAGRVICFYICIIFFFCEDEYKLTKNCVRVEAIAPFMMCLGSLGAILGNNAQQIFFCFLITL